MAEPKTRPTDVPVEDFLETVQDEQTRQDCRTLIDIMSQATRAEACMWGPSIIGFGTYKIVYANGRELDWPQVGFSPRKANIALYLMCGAEHDEELLAKFGKYTRAKSCLYIKKIADIHLPTLKKMVREAVKDVKKQKASSKTKAG